MSAEEIIGFEEEGQYNQARRMDKYTSNEEWRNGFG